MGDCNHGDGTAPPAGRSRSVGMATARRKGEERALLRTGRDFPRRHLRNAEYRERMCGETGTQRLLANVLFCFEPEPVAASSLPDHWSFIINV